MLACPNCSTRLARRRTTWGLVHACPVCGGFVAGFHVLRKERVAQDFLAEAWQRARDPSGPKGKRCPSCGIAMALVSTEVRKDKVELDVCARCSSIWFDAGEHAVVPRAGPDEPGAAGDGGGHEELEAEFERQRGGATRAAAWQYAPGLLGLPVEFDVPVVRSRPWVTWGAAALCVLVFVGALVAGGGAALGSMIHAWGFEPAMWGRLGGATLVTGFFLHAGVWHLVGNTYFLIVFGDNVEDQLGWKRFALLLLFAHLAGTVLHGVLEPRSALPLVGASAGISGVIAYYAVAFPKARLGMLFFFVFWLRLPAYAWLVLWIILQAFTAHSQLAGATNVSALGHLGGAAVGLLAALSVRRRRREALDLAGVHRGRP